MSTADTQNEYPENVVPLRSEADRIAHALTIAKTRRYQALLDSLHAAKKAHSREWVSFDWDASELVEKK